MVIYKLEVVEGKVMGVACNELGVMVMAVEVEVMMGVESTLHMVVEAEAVLYMVEVKVVEESELEGVGNKQEVAVISMDKLVVEVNVVAVVVSVVAVEVNNEAVVGSYSSKELVEVGEVVN